MKFQSLMIIYKAFNKQNLVLIRDLIVIADHDYSQISGYFYGMWNCTLFSRKFTVIKQNRVHSSPYLIIKGPVCNQEMLGGGRCPGLLHHFLE